MNEDARLHPALNLQTMPAGVTPPGLLGALPDGWVMIGRCRYGTAGPANYPTGCFALAHPMTGIALIDIAPDVTPNAEARLRRTLAAADFQASRPGVLPIWHGRIELSAWRSLPGIVAEGFAELPPLTVGGKDAWVVAAREALARDPAWEVPRIPASPLPVIEGPDFDYEPEADPHPAPPRSRARRLGLPIGFAVTFVLGLASGALFLSSEGSPPAPPTADLTTPAAASAPPVEMARATPAEPELPAAESPAAAARAPDPVAAPAPMPTHAVPAAMPSPPAPAQPPPTVQAAVSQTTGIQTTGSQATDIHATGSQAIDPPEPPQSLAAVLPLPPALPRPPVQKAARPPAQIDKACSRALYRFAQGEALTAAEQAFLREGCATRR